MQLYPSQENYLSKLGDRPYLFAEVGTGKTLMTLFRAHRAGARKVLVICPASVRDTKGWEIDLEKSGLEFDVFEVRGYHFLQKNKASDFRDYQDYYVIIDEAHKIKNSQSAQGIGAWKLCRATKLGYSFLSGTPMSKWEDAVNYAKITGLVKHKTAFFNRYVVQRRAFAHKGMETIGYNHTDELADWWRNISLRLLAEDCVELPKKQVIKIDIPIKRTEYVRLIKERMTADGEPIDSAPKMNWALRRTAESAPEKIAWAVDKIDGLENCLVFANTTDGINTLSAALKRAGIKHGIWSGTKKNKFAEQKVMIVQYQAGGTGLNLQAFNTTIFLSPCYSFQDYTQAVGRTYRNGQQENCTFFQLRAKDTIDTAIYEALNDKKDFDENLGAAKTNGWTETI